MLQKLEMDSISFTAIAMCRCSFMFTGKIIYHHSISSSQIKPQNLNVFYLLCRRNNVIKLSRYFICANSSLVLFVNSLPDAVKLQIRCCNRHYILMALQYIIIIAHFNFCSVEAVWFWFMYLKAVTWEVPEGAGRHLWVPGTTGNPQDYLIKSSFDKIVNF